MGVAPFFLPIPHAPPSTQGVWAVVQICPSTYLYNMFQSIFWPVYAAIVAAVVTVWVGFAAIKTMLDKMRERSVRRKMAKK